MRAVHVEQIREEGLVLHEPLERSFLARALEGGLPDTEFQARGGAAFHATLRKVSGGVILEGRLTAPVAAPCHRCLAEVALDVPVAFMLNLVPSQRLAGEETEEEGEGTEEGEPVGSFALGEADQEPFDGKTIDLDPIVREQVLLALPMSVLCRAECRGLCPVCGQDLNVESCSCDRRVPDPRLAALKNIKLS
jgi:uncharacterized protein